MRGISGQFGARVWFCCAMVGAGGLGGLVGGYMFDANRISAQEAVANIKVSAAEAVSFRFPNQWHDGEAEAEVENVAAAEPVEPAAPATRYAVASVGSLPISLGPKPLAEAVVAKATEDVPETQLPPWAMAAPVPLPTPRRSWLQWPWPRPAAGRSPTSNAVLNGTQIASIKRRLNLTPDQERYWPAVEAQLRKMEYKKGPKRHPHGIDRHEQDGRAGPSHRGLPAGHELQRRTEARTQVARPPAGPRERDVRILA